MMMMMMMMMKAQSCDLHHCQLLIGRIRQLTTIESTNDVAETEPACTLSTAITDCCSNIL